MKRPAMLLCALGAIASSRAARALPAESPAPPVRTATFALIIGANDSVDHELKPLLYADDDAARYYLLFRSLGARTVLLTRPDDNTRRVLPSAVAFAALPRRRALNEAVATLANEVRSARAIGIHTAFYFLFAGHGNAHEGQAYLTLEDYRLTGDELDRAVLREVGAAESHVIVDACYSYYLAYQRGPGGRARMVRGFSASAGGLSPEVGLLLSTSSGRESHEWDGFQAGVFSHEVRSGLHGAADLDGDGRISYREIAAFVVRANAAIPNDRLRPDVFARPPHGSTRLLDLRPGLDRSVVVDPEAKAGHYLLEDRAGNRLVEFHSAPNKQVRLIRSSEDTMFLRHVPTGHEHELASTAGQVHIARLLSKPAPVRSRGAAHHAFSLIFSLAFDEGALAHYRLPDPELASSAADQPPPVPVWRRALAVSAVVGSAAAGVTSGALVLSSRRAAREAADATQRRAGELNQQVESRRRQALWFGAASVVSAAGALALWLWPTAPVAPTASASMDEAPVFGIGGRF
jgi:hypothetical protein